VGLEGIGANMANQEYQQAFNNWNTQNNNLYQRLFQGAQLGSKQATGVSSLGQQAATNEGLLGMQGSQAIGNSMQQGGQAVLQGYNAYNQYQLGQQYT